MIAFLKAIHIGALSLWCAGLILLPVLMHQHGRRTEMRTQAGFSEFRWLTHYSYTCAVSPAAVIAVAAGTALIFAAQVFDIWMMLKLVAVAGMVAVHALLGHLIVQVGEGRGQFHLPRVGLTLVVILPLIGTVLWLVLAKPDLKDLVDLLPEALLEPRGNTIPARLDPL